VASAFPFAQDIADYLRELGYGEFGPSQIIGFAADVAESTHPQEFLKVSKVLASHFPAYRDYFRQYIATREQWLSTLRREVLGGNAS